MVIRIGDYKEGDKCPICKKGYLEGCREVFCGIYEYLKCNNCGETIEDE